MFKNFILNSVFFANSIFDITMKSLSGLKRQGASFNLILIAFDLLDHDIQPSKNPGLQNFSGSFGIIPRGLF